MKALLQRVSRASVTVEGKLEGEIPGGLLVFLGVGPEDTEQEVDRLLKKIFSLRVFEDKEGKMNFSMVDTEGSLLVVSQFTLFADCRKGNRPSFTGAAPPALARSLYETFLERAKEQFPGRVASGRFGADMKVELVNDGPVTILLDTEESRKES